MPLGLDKSIVVSHLIKTGEIVPGFAFALGDRPTGNDEGLTRWHLAEGGEDIPFIAVSEHPELVPQWMSDTHVRRLSNAEASAAVLRGLADRLAGDIEALYGLANMECAAVASAASSGNELGLVKAAPATVKPTPQIGILVREVVGMINQANSILPDEDRRSE